MQITAGSNQFLLFSIGEIRAINKTILSIIPAGRKVLKYQAIQAIVIMTKGFDGKDGSGVTELTNHHPEITIYPSIVLAIIYGNSSEGVLTFV